MVTLLNKLQCNDQESFSDDSIITFHILKSKDIAKDYNFHGTKYVTNEDGFKTFDDNLLKKLKTTLRSAK